MGAAGLILAGGEGSRLAASGVATPKAAVRVAGRPQAVRLADALRRAGCDPIACTVRDTVAGTLAALPDLAEVRLVTCHTPTSLHTLAVGLEALPAGTVMCTMVDCVMRDADWFAALDALAAGLSDGASAGVVVTPLIEDERPLHVELDQHGLVRRFGGPSAPRPLVTAGVYAFGPVARAGVRPALGAGVQRMRGYLAWLVEQGHRIAAVEVHEVVDLDTARDLARATALLEAGV